MTVLKIDDELSDPIVDCGVESGRFRRTHDRTKDRRSGDLLCVRMSQVEFG